MLPLLLWLALDWRAEFCGHSVPYAGTTYFTADHIVVEIEVLPDKSTPIRLTSGEFRLRINGKKDLLAPETPSMVAASLQYSDWSQRPRLVAQAGPIIVGRPRQQPRFPGDTRPGQPPNRPVDRQDDHPATKTDAEAIVEAALPEGPTLGPTKGLVYFPYRGKLKSLKTIELLWGERILKLQ